MRSLAITQNSRPAAIAALLAAGMLTLVPDPAAAAAPFAGLAGRWSGGGHATFDSGQRERLRCSATYRTSGNGSNLSMSLRCASASATINLHGSLHASGSRVSGSWSESTYGIGGDAVGSAHGGSMRLRFTGSTAGTLSVAVGHSSQSVSITAHGSSLRSVNVSLGRR